MKAEDVNLALYAEGMSLIFRSGIFDFLRDRGRVGSVPVGTPDYSLVHISQMNKSIGFNLALDELLEFREKFLQDEPSEVPVMDFGGVSNLLKNNIISEEEANVIRKQLSVR